MKKSLLHILFATAFMLISGFSYAQHDADSKALADKLNQNWNNLFNQGDVAALSQLYAEKALISPNNGKVLSGNKAITELFQSFVDAGVHNHTIEVVESDLDGDTLYQVSYWQASGQTKDGVTPTFGGVVTLISKRNDAGEWKLHVHSWNLAN